MTLEILTSKNAFTWRQHAGRLRLKAQLAGESKYHNPWPCPHGHTVRYASNGKCVQCHTTHVERRNAQRKSEIDP